MRPEYVQGYLDALVTMGVLCDTIDIYSRQSYSDCRGNVFVVEHNYLIINHKRIPYEDIIAFDIYEGELKVEHYAKTCEYN